MGTNETSSFFSMLLRMKYIRRWGLMRCNVDENLAEHTLDVAVLSHALAVIGNRMLGKKLDAPRAAMLALYHDASEIFTGDLPTPIKYHDAQITSAYKQVEAAANERLFSELPSILSDDYVDCFSAATEDEYLWLIIKAADKVSALIKCVEESKTGNTEFDRARQTIEEAIEKNPLPELKIFMEQFFESFTKSLDDQ